MSFRAFGRARRTDCLRLLRQAHDPLHAPVLRRRPSERRQNEAVRITKVGDQDKGLHAGDIWMSILFPPNGIAKVTDDQREMIRFGRAHDGFKSSVC